MQHSRGIELFAEADRRKATRENFSLGDVAKWYDLYGKCFICGHVGHIDRWELARKFGKARPILDMMPHLRCTRCGNKATNSFCVSLLPR